MQRPLPVLFLYDESCRIIWISHAEPPYTVKGVVGQFPWFSLNETDARDCQAAFARCVAGDSPQVIDSEVAGLGRWRTRIYRARIAASRVRFVGFAEPWPPQVLLLTMRERQVCLALARSGRSKQAARELGLSASTVDTHRVRIATKLGITTDSLISWCGFHAAWLTESDSRG